MKEIIKRILVKLTSSKFLVAVWSMVMVSFLVFSNTAKENVALTTLLASTPIAYCGLNVVQKHSEKNE